MKYLVPIGLIIILIGFGTADALLTELVIPEGVMVEEKELIEEETEETKEAEETEEVEATEEPEEEETIGVRRSTGPDVLQEILDQGLTHTTTSEKTLLKKIVPSDLTVHSHAILADNDRAGSISWIDSTKVKIYFRALKEALHTSFSPSVSDLIDETQRVKGRPTMNLLTFFDAELSPERIVFVRVRQRLYELHVTEGNDDAIFALIDELTK